MINSNELMRKLKMEFNQIYFPLELLTIIREYAQHCVLICPSYTHVYFIDGWTLQLLKQIEFGASIISMCCYHTKDSTFLYYVNNTSLFSVNLTGDLSISRTPINYIDDSEIELNSRMESIKRENPSYEYCSYSRQIQNIDWYSKENRFIISEQKSGKTNLAWMDLDGVVSSSKFPSIDRINKNVLHDDIMMGFSLSHSNLIIICFGGVKIFNLLSLQIISWLPFPFAKQRIHVRPKWISNDRSLLFLGKSYPTDPQHIEAIILNMVDDRYWIITTPYHATNEVIIANQNIYRLDPSKMPPTCSPNDISLHAHPLNHHIAICMDYKNCLLYHANYFQTINQDEKNSSKQNIIELLQNKISASYLSNYTQMGCSIILNL